MTRTADYTIQGFLYQFNKTLLEILNSPDGAEITVEGIIEDIEISSPSGVTATQCKYHETKDSFTLSTIYKPLLQMMQHFHTNPKCNIKYVVFAHFPKPPEEVPFTLAAQDLEAALSSTNKDLAGYVKNLKGKIDGASFLKCFAVEFGPAYDALVAEVHKALHQAGIPASDIDTLAYPNAIQAIASLSIKHDPKERCITKLGLLDDLKKIKSTAVSRWTLGLKTREEILKARQKQLKDHLDKNSRLRYFIIREASLDSFDADIVGFICDYLDKYHFKPAHINTPIFCLDTTEARFKDIRVRLHKKGIVATDGFINDYFDEKYFFRAPMRQKDSLKEIQREFAIRLIDWKTGPTVLNHQKCDDLFLLGEGDYSTLETQDVNVEMLEAANLKEIKYMLGVSNAYQ